MPSLVAVVNLSRINPAIPAARLKRYAKKSLSTHVRPETGRSIFMKVEKNNNTARPRDLGSALMNSAGLVRKFAKRHQRKICSSRTDCAEIRRRAELDKSVLQKGTRCKKEEKIIISDSGGGVGVYHTP